MRVLILIVLVASASAFYVRQAENEIDGGSGSGSGRMDEFEEAAKKIIIKIAENLGVTDPARMETLVQLLAQPVAYILEAKAKCAAHNGALIAKAIRLLVEYGQSKEGGSGSADGAEVVVATRAVQFAQRRADKLKELQSLSKRFMDIANMLNHADERSISGGSGDRQNLIDALGNLEEGRKNAPAESGSAMMDAVKEKAANKIDPLKDISGSGSAISDAAREKAANKNDALKQLAGSGSGVHDAAKDKVADKLDEKKGSGDGQESAEERLLRWARAGRLLEQLIGDSESESSGGSESIIEKIIDAKKGGSSPAPSPTPTPSAQPSPAPSPEPSAAPSPAPAEGSGKLINYAKFRRALADLFASI